MNIQKEIYNYYYFGISKDSLIRISSSFEIHFYYTIGASFIPQNFYLFLFIIIMCYYSSFTPHLPLAVSYVLHSIKTSRTIPYSITSKRYQRTEVESKPKHQNKLFFLVILSAVEIRLHLDRISKPIHNKSFLGWSTSFRLY